MSSTLPPVRTPSAADLVAMLSDEIPAPPPQPVIALPRPRWWLRLALILCVGVLACFAAGTMVAAFAVAQVADRIRANDRAQAVPLQSPLPPNDVLLDHTAYLRARAQRSDDGVVLVLARVDALRQAGRNAEALATCREAGAARHHPHLTLTWAELLIQDGQITAAQAQLDTLIGQNVPESLIPRIARLVDTLQFSRAAVDG